jgi:hypothetical protein
MAPECRYIKTSGGKCGSPALRGQPYCYFHSRLPKEKSTARATQEEPSSLKLAFASLEDRAAIQHAVSEVGTALAEHRINARRARTLLYALQIASSEAIS